MMGVEFWLDLGGAGTGEIKILVFRTGGVGGGVLKWGGGGGGGGCGGGGGKVGVV